MRLIVIIVALMFARTSGAATYVLPADGSDVIGEIMTVTATFEDTLVDIARRHGVGYQDIVRANPGVDVWVPGEGTQVVIPTRYVLPPAPRTGVVLNLAEYRMYYYPEPAAGQPAEVMTFPISIGRRDWETPIGVTRIVAKAVNPSWYPPQSVRDEHAAEGRPLPSVVPPGPDNPLGKHALRLALPGYLIHGTNRPAGVGMRVTHGCLRMFPEDVEYLYSLVGVNTSVRIINEPVKIGWLGDELVMEVHPLLESAPAETVDEPQREGGDRPQTDDVSVQLETGESPDDAAADGTAGEAVSASDVDAEPDKDPLTYVTEQFVVATAERPGQLDWQLVETVVARADGMPVAVGEGIKNAATSAAFE
ncbi:MAG: L,D-transpeptidase family protein [Woeseiaceae bacterium]|nr:L,D-transpeptidase family protein [Woeseiaceae bacterium]